MPHLKGIFVQVNSNYMWSPREAYGEAEVDMRMRVRLRSSCENGEEQHTSLLTPWVGCRYREESSERSRSCEIYNLYINRRVLWYLVIHSFPAPSPPLFTLPGWFSCGSVTCGWAPFSPRGLEDWFSWGDMHPGGCMMVFGVWEEVTWIFI